MTQTPYNVAFCHGGHDHQACIADALARAESVCSERGLRLTAIRRRVLELIWDSHKPAKAYDLLNAISAERGSAAPPTVYRALDFLLDAGLVHKIESLNAFIGCDRSRHTGDPKFLICRGCERVEEIPSPEIDAAIEQAARRAGFAVDHETIEVGGLCSACAE